MRHFKTTFLRIFFIVGFLTICAVIPANAQNLETREIELKECIQMFRQQSFIIKDQTTFLKEIRNDMRRDWCLKNLEKIDFDKHTLIGIELNTGYCDVPLLYPTQVSKNEAQKQFLVKIRYLEPNESCRARSQYDLWLLVPKLPENYTVKFDVKPEVRPETTR